MAGITFCGITCVDHVLFDSCLYDLGFSTCKGRRIKLLNGCFYSLTYSKDLMGFKISLDIFWKRVNVLVAPETNNKWKKAGFYSDYDLSVVVESDE